MDEKEKEELVFCEHFEIIDMRLWNQPADNEAVRKWAKILDDIRYGKPIKKKFRWRSIDDE